jgi:hypothetical protein
MVDYNEADEGSGDSGVMAAPGPSRDAVKKLDQIIQVIPLLNCTGLPMLILLELSYQSSHCCHPIPDANSTYFPERWQQESQ